jgi:hypothetical protein
MVRFLLILIGALFLLVGCDTRKNGVANNAAKESTSPFLFRMQLFFDESESIMSFPIWFDDSLIRQNKIFHLTREIYHISVNNADEGVDEDLDLREKRDYYFDQNGLVDSVRINYFFDDRSIGCVRYIYRSKPDQYGYSAKIDRIINIPGDQGMVQAQIPFQTFSAVFSSKKYLSYRDRESGKFYHYILNERNYGPLSVDSIVHPSPNDVIVLGTPEKSIKKYSVANTVHESNVHLYSYENNQVKTIERTEYPFVVKRTMTYDMKGICTGFIDSTFSDQNYLTSSKSKFKLNTKCLPLELLRVKDNQESKINRVSLEKYSYEVYEK